jgi:hypothetical protein
MSSLKVEKWKNKTTKKKKTPEIIIKTQQKKFHVFFVPPKNE